MMCINNNNISKKGGEFKVFGRRGLGWKFKTAKLSFKLLPDHGNKPLLSFV
jgi:hypothetical protein